MTKAEEKLLLEATKGTPHHLMFAIALYTGLRPNEYETAKIDGEFIVAINSKRKNNKIEYKKIPITPMLAPYLAGLSEIKFCSLRILRDRFNKLFPNHKLYDLRTTFYRLVCERREEYEGNAEFRMEGNVLVLPLLDEDTTYTVLYYPSIPRVTSETDDNTELDIPDKIATHIPYFVKGDLFRDDEPDEANEARNWFEMAMEQVIQTKQSHSGKVFTKLSQTEI